MTNKKIDPTLCKWEKKRYQYLEQEIRLLSMP